MGERDRFYAAVGLELARDVWMWLRAVVTLINRILAISRVLVPLTSSRRTSISREVNRKAVELGEEGRPEVSQTAGRWPGFLASFLVPCPMLVIIHLLKP